MSIARTRYAHSPAVADDEVPVRTRRWCSFVMIPLAALDCLIQTSFAAQPTLHPQATAGFLWMVLATLLSFALPFALRWRGSHPELVFWCCVAATLIFPYGPGLLLMAMAALLARRSSLHRNAAAVTVGTVVTIWSQLRDTLRVSSASFWQAVFARPGTGMAGVPIELLAGKGTIMATAIIVALIETAVATLVGLHIRSRASLTTAQAQADAATTHAATLQHDLNNQQLADAIAAEAHDTLAHSLSLLALNASALQAEAGKLGDHPGARSLSDKAGDIRRQAAGALDEAHAIIDMLRHPATARQQLAPSEETALTRESLDSLIGEARAAGMELNTWIDIQQLSALDDRVAKVAYRAIQEALTNARRHAPSAPVSLQVDAAPGEGVHVHASNPSPSAACESAAPDESEPTQHDGAGLAGLLARTQSAGGTCHWWFDERQTFHMDVTLPWIAPRADGLH